MPAAATPDTRCAAGGCTGRPVASGLCNAHRKRMKRLGTLALPTAMDRFMAKVVEEPMSGCWLWGGGLSGGGYGAFTTDRRQRRAHRWLYEQTVGPIPEGLELDHLCQTPACVNPGHLEPVTSAENLRRKGERTRFCPQRHPYDERNTYVTKRRAKSCRECARLAATQRRERRSADVAA